LHLAEEACVNHRVLVIDDDRNAGRTIERILQRAGYRVISAVNGAEGLRLWRHTRPDLVITEVVMPEQDGIETMLAIRKLEPRAKILAMTGYLQRGMVNFLEIIRSLGADGVLAKPFRGEQLLVEVDACLQLPAAA
jgi:CheY-like chemotaxis protein